MNLLHINSASPLGKINECLRGLPENNLVHSKGRPDAARRNKICVRFAASLPVEFEVRPFAEASAQTQAGSPAHFLFRSKSFQQKKQQQPRSNYENANHQKQDHAYGGTGSARDVYDGTGSHRDDAGRVPEK
jgi:hypothetical protein